MCAGFTLGKLNAWAGWRGDGVRQPIRSMNNNRVANLENHTVGRCCRDALTATETSEAMFLPVRSLTLIAIKAKQQLCPAGIGSRVKLHPHKRWQQHGGDGIYLSEKKCSCRLGGNACRQAMSSFVVGVENQCGGAAARGAARGAVAVFVQMARKAESCSSSVLSMSASRLRVAASAASCWRGA